ncbi:DNA polymerase III subunit alpha [Cellulomonas citrea]|uniref:DNA polymerase III subunit alpha n=1 Tax=Cellulomonas citrea TaxID=1909423 RepID=UPI0013567A5C|nr:DNA polymerase III subunit alpha [Cellulomonas citrea]
MPSTTEPRYAELHAHTAYSFLDGASQPEELAAEAARLGLSALAVTDHDGLYGVVRFAQAARAVGLPTVFGAELHLPAADARRHGRRPARPGPAVLDEPTGVPDPRATHLLVLARGPEGYRRLSRAIAEGHLRTGRKGTADYRLEELAALADGHWLVLSGCRKGAVRRALAGGDPSGVGGVAPGGSAAARVELDRLVGLFGADNVAVETTVVGDAYDDDRVDALAMLAAEAHLPLVATGGVHVATPRDADLVQALAAVRARSSLEDLDGWLPGAPSAHLRSAVEMLDLHRRHPQAVRTADALGRECAFDLSLVAPGLPPYPVPAGHTEASWLRELVRRGAYELYGPPQAEKVPGAYAQLEHELAVIEDLGFPGYFLVVYDLVDFCRRAGIFAQGRGSAANSAVCYALRVTAVDAVRHGLLFERFLAPERDGPPDIDIDIESARREEVIQYVYARHGREHAAQVANVISYRPRSAVRDAARALGHDVGQQDAWSTSIERWGSLRGPREQSSWWTVSRAAPVAASRAVEEAAGAPTPDRHDVVPAHRPPAADELEEIPDAVIDLAERFLRLPRHLGIHSGGMVMCDRPVIEVCPVEWARMPGRTVLQWDKDDCADAGLVKFDLLGLGMLTALRMSFTQIAELGGPSLGLHDLPHEDPGVYALLQAADSVGVFQVESRAQMATLPRLAPKTFYDIVVEVALIRPGPIQGGSVHPYIERVKEREPITYLHPSLEKSLSKTLGVPLFQEQLMEMAMDVASFTPAEADQLRRAMGSKRSMEKMEALHGRLLAGMARNGIDRATGEQIYDKLRAFADFGFPESHAYSFAYLVYASAWLKVHHPAAFYAGLLGAQPMGFYTPQSLVADARRHGIEVLGPDVQASAVLARVERTGPPPPDGEPPLVPLPSGTGRAEPGTRSLAVRLGLSSVRSVGQDVAGALVEARTTGGPFADLHDLVHRVRLTRTQLEALATAGALVGLGVDRRAGLWAAGALAAEGPDTLPSVAVGVRAPMLPGLEAVELATADVWATGISTDSYPTQFVREGLDEAGVLRVADVHRAGASGRVAVAGVVTHRQRPGTARGVTFLSLEDETGLLNVVCSAGLWQRFRAAARTSAALVVRGQLEKADGATNLVAEHLAPLSLRVRTTSRDFR